MTRLRSEQLKDKSGKFGNYRGFIKPSRFLDPMLKRDLEQLAKDTLKPRPSTSPRIIVRKKAG